MASATCTRRARIILTFLLLAAPLTARAQSSKEEKQARALQVEGLHLMEKGNNREALEKFEEAYKLVQSPRVLFNRAKAHHALGDDVEALVDFERFLDEAPFAPKESRDEARHVIEELQPRVAYLEIQSDESDVDITVDGRAIGSTPIAKPIVVARGTHVVKGTKSGMNDDVHSESVIPGQKLRVVVKLTPIAKPAELPPVAVAPPPTEPPATEPAPPAAPQEPAPASPAERPWQYTGGWIALGAGVLLVGGGVAAQLWSQSNVSAFNAETKAPNPSGKCNKMLSMDGGGDCQSLADSAQTHQTFAIVGYVAGGVALAGSLVLFLSGSSSSQHSAQRDAAAACSPTTGGFACALALRF